MVFLKSSLVKEMKKWNLERYPIKENGKIEYSKYILRPENDILKIIKVTKMGNRIFTINYRK